MAAVAGSTGSYGRSSPRQVSSWCWRRLHLPAHRGAPGRAPAGFPLQHCMARQPGRLRARTPERTHRRARAGRWRRRQGGDPASARHPGQSGRLAAGQWSGGTGCQPSRIGRHRCRTRRSRRGGGADGRDPGRDGPPRAIGLTVAARAEVDGPCRGGEHPGRRQRRGGPAATQSAPLDLFGHTSRACGVWPLPCWPCCCCTTDFSDAPTASCTHRTRGSTPR